MGTGCYPPHAENGRGVQLKTTEEIVDELSDMVETDTTTVATLMAEAGHSIRFDQDGRHGWALSPRIR